MKLNRISTLLAASCLLMLGGLASNVSAQRKREVRVYFPNSAESKDMKNNPSNLQPVTRTVSAAAPLRPALEALLEGPTPEEQQKGFMALDSVGMEIVRLEVKNGTARASFARKPQPGWAGDLSPLTFRAAVERTLKQFQGVRRTIVCVDGLLNFGALGETRDQKCPK